MVSSYPRFLNNNIFHQKWNILFFKLKVNKIKIDFFLFLSQNPQFVFHTRLLVLFTSLVSVGGSQITTVPTGVRLNPGSKQSIYMQIHASQDLICGIENIFARGGQTDRRWSEEGEINHSPNRGVVSNSSQHQMWSELWLWR